MHKEQSVGVVSGSWEAIMFTRSVVLVFAAALGSGALAQTGAAPPAPVTPPAGGPRAITPAPPAVGPVRRVVTPPGQAASPARSEPTRAAVERKNVDLAVGQVEIVIVPQTIGSILIGQAEVADISTISERSFAVTAKKAGFTSMLLLNPENQEFFDISISVIAEPLAGRRPANVVAVALGKETRTITAGVLTITVEEDKRLDHSYRCEGARSCTFDQSTSESKPEQKQ